MQKKWFMTVLATLLLVGLAACASIQAPGGAQQGSSSSSASGSGGALPSLSVSLKLAVGTLKLEGTDQAVTPEQAKALLPLWKAVKVLGSSDTISQAEIEALYEQIQETMTAEQMQAIEDMGLSQADMRALAQELGIELSGGFTGADVQRTPQANSGSSSSRRDGPPADMPMPPDGGGMFFQSSSSGQSATAVAGQTSSRMRLSGNNPFTDALIKLLKERAG